MRLVLWKLSTSTSYDFIIWLPSQFDLLPMIFWDSSTLYYSNSLLFKTWEYKLSSSSMKNIAKDFFPNMCGIIVGLILIFFLFFLKTNKIWTNEIYTYSLRMVFFSENDFFLVALPFSLLLEPLPHHSTRAENQLLLLLLLRASNTLILTKFIYEAKFTSWKGMLAKYLFHHF